MKISAAFPSKYLKAPDLDDKEIRLVIARVEIESITDDEKKPVVYFTKAKKGLVLNKTNAKAISTAYGDDTDLWEDKEIVLFPMMVQFRDDMVESIRVKIPKVAVASKPKPAAPTEADPPDQIDDDIPW
jgi:hypothetical protein